MISFLDRIDSAPLADDNFSFTFNSWVSVTVDTLNENISDIQNQFNGISDGLLLPQKTTAQITALIAMNALPVFSAGTIWFDTTLGKIVVLVTAAVPGVSNGVTETVTST